MGQEITFSGISIEGTRKIGDGQLATYFAVPDGKEDLAVKDILSCLAAEYIVSLSNDLDEGHEGSTTFRKSSSGLEMMTGGHGWSSNWKPIDEAEAVASIKSLAPLNRGGHWSSRGTYYCEKKERPPLPPNQTNQEQSSKVNNKRNPFLKYVIVDGALKIGLISFSTYCFIDFVVGYFSPVTLNDYSFAYFIKALIFGVSLGLLIGFINWVFQGGRKN